MKRLILILTGFLFVSAGSAEAQFGFSDFVNDKLIRSLDDVLYVVKQEYAVRGPDSLLYGRDNSDIWGHTYGPAVLWKEHLVTSRYTWFPYQRDTSFRSLGANYVPEPTRTRIRKLQDASWSVLREKPETKEPFAFHIPLQDSVSIGHAHRFAEAKVMNSVIITYMSRDSILTDESEFEYNYLDTRVTWNEEGKGTLEHPDPGPDEKFGLLFYEYRSPGNTALVLGGFVEINEKGKWQALKIDQHPEEAAPEVKDDQH